VGGGVTREGIQALRAVGAVVVPVIEAPMSVEAAIARGLEPVTTAGERIAGIISMGLALRAPTAVS
jgi:hypothetical protein